MDRPHPTQPAPALKITTVQGDTWQLAEQTDPFTLIVFYRGFHCPVCRVYLRELAGNLAAFEQRNIGVIAISTDSLDRAQATQNEWQLNELKLGHSLDIDTARQWGLYISNAIKEGEPEQFAEPGLALVRGDGTLYAMVVQTMPFTRPKFDEILAAIDFITANDYPARGEA